MYVIKKQSELFLELPYRVFQLKLFNFQNGFVRKKELEYYLFFSSFKFRQDINIHFWTTNLFCLLSRIYDDCERTLLRILESALKSFRKDSDLKRILKNNVEPSKLVQLILGHPVSFLAISWLYTAKPATRYYTLRLLIIGATDHGIVQSTCQVQDLHKNVYRVRHSNRY